MNNEQLEDMKYIMKQSLKAMLDDMYEKFTHIIDNLTSYQAPAPSADDDDSDPDPTDEFPAVRIETDDEGLSSPYISDLDVKMCENCNQELVGAHTPICINCADDIMNNNNPDVMFWNDAVALYELLNNDDEDDTSADDDDNDPDDSDPITGIDQFDFSLSSRPRKPSYSDSEEDEENDRPYEDWGYKK